MVARPFFDEIYAPDRSPRRQYRVLAEWLEGTPQPRIEQKWHEAEIAFHLVGITFVIHGEKSGTPSSPAS